LCRKTPQSSPRGVFDQKKMILQKLKSAKSMDPVQDSSASARGIFNAKSPRLKRQAEEFTAAIETTPVEETSAWPGFQSIFCMLGV
jgi:hypothetical protein